MGDNGEDCIYRSGHDAKITLIITLLTIILTVLCGQTVWVNSEIKGLAERVLKIETVEQFEHQGEVHWQSEYQRQDKRP